MKYAARTLLKMALGMSPLWACEFDVQLGHGDDTGGSTTGEETIDRSDRYRLLLAVQIFEGELPLQFLMEVAIGEDWKGKPFIWGWTRWLPSGDPLTHIESEWFVVWPDAGAFTLELDPAHYPTATGATRMTIYLHGRAIDENFLCGLATVETVGSADRPFGAMTFAAHRLGSSPVLPDLVKIDCDGTEVPRH